MKHDVFFSISQTPVDGWAPDERGMMRRFFEQARLADALGFGTAWVAETHLSCQVQKRNPGAVIPHFEGEIGINTDLLQLAHVLFAQTKRIQVGSAIRNILCNGGPMAHAEAVRTFLLLHGLNESEERKLELGFASGRFPFSTVPYGVRPRNALEEAAWPVLKGLLFVEAVEIFLRFTRGDVFSSRDVAPKLLRRSQFRSDADWAKVLAVAGPQKNASEIEIPSFWTFDDVGVIPFEAPLHLLNLTIGSHDPATQVFANTLYPCGVFNLSITPTSEIEETHARMSKAFHSDGGPWSRAKMPRTALVFIDDGAQGGASARRRRAHERAEKALGVYWKALEGTIDPAKVSRAVDNALVGGPEDVLEQMNERFHPDDRLMLWFDFYNHDSEAVQHSMRTYMEKVAPFATGRSASKEAQ